MKSVACMTEGAVKKIVNQFPQNNPRVEIHRGKLAYAVTVNGEKIFSAARVGRNTFHVMAKPGLLTAA